MAARVAHHQRSCTDRCQTGGHKGPHTTLHHPRPYKMTPALFVKYPSLDASWAALAAALLLQAGPVYCVTP